MKAFISAFVATLALIGSIGTAKPAQAASCQFVLGFAALHDLAPGVVGDCLDNEVRAKNGDSVQHTTNGLLVWRKADNWTAFTNGYMTWLNGPDGLAIRLNSQRFRWEQLPGTRANPMSIGTPADVGDGLALTVDSVIPDAGELVRESSAYNLLPANGVQFFMAKILLHNGGSGPVRVDGVYAFRAAAPSALDDDYDPLTSGCGLYPGRLPVADIPAEATLSGSVCFAVQAADASALELYYEPAAPSEGRVYFSLSPQPAA